MNAGGKEKGGEGKEKGEGKEEEGGGYIPHIENVRLHHEFKKVFH